MSCWSCLAGLLFPCLLLAQTPSDPPATPEQLFAGLRKTYPHNPVPAPEAQQKQFDVHPDFEVKLFASSPWVVNPIAMAWDAHNRLWVVNSPMYPHILPGQRHMDFISVLEDADGDGRADKCTIFYDRLYVPTGLALGDGGVYVANQPDLVFLKDTDGDLRADQRRIYLSGFGTEDTHQAINSFRWHPGGALYFMSGKHPRTVVETPHGIVQSRDVTTFRLHPRAVKLEIVHQGQGGNPRGLAFDRWGQPFAADEALGGITWLTPGTVSSRPREPLPHSAAPPGYGIEFLESRHFTTAYQGMLVHNAVKAKAVYLYAVGDDGAGYAARQIQPPVIQSREPFFRPVDVKQGPDGALYVADFFQEIIDHGEHSFRDPRRDHLNGRIWRIKQKGRPPLPRPNFPAMTLAQVCAELKSPESYRREMARRVLYDRSAQEFDAVVTALRAFAQDHDPTDPNVEQHRLEALWALQSIDVVEPNLLRAILRSREPHARAAAVRVLRSWSREMPEARDLLAEAVRDEFPRVRLEALCALSDLPEAKTMELAAQAADLPMDRFLQYAFQHTAMALQARWLPAFLAGQIDFNNRPTRLHAALAAINNGDAVGLLLRLLKADRVPAEQRPRLLALVATLGTAREQTELFDSQAFGKLFGGDYDPQLHAQVLEALAGSDHARTLPNREKMLADLLAMSHPSLHTAALKLIGAWKMTGLQGEVESRAKSDQVSEGLRLTAMDVLADLGGNGAVVLKSLAKDGSPFPVRSAAIAALARIDLFTSAQQAAACLTQDPGSHDLNGMLHAILSRQGGADALTAALQNTQLHPDAAKLALRFTNAVGTPHPPLVALLSRQAGVGDLAKQLLQEDLQKLLADVQTKGDPRRGEVIFRRRDLACLSCHAVAGGGAQVGPDLEGIGFKEKLDYIAESLLAPNKTVRAGYAAVKILTDDGKLHHGVLLLKNAKETVIRDAQSHQVVTIPADKIEEMGDAPSIMPDGLVNQMTRAEFLDLVRFCGELGKPGPFAAPTLPIVRSWKVLEKSPTAEVPQLLQRKDGALWRSEYSMVSGELPLSDLGPGPVAIVQTRIDVGTPGAILLKLNSTRGVELWLDGMQVTLADETRIDVRSGSRWLTFRLHLPSRSGLGLHVQLGTAPGSPARAVTAKGPLP